MLMSAPLYVSWNYTYACNFNCSHCYSRAASYPKELNTHAYLDVVDQFLEAKVMRVGLGGGEPLIRRDCVEILARMAEGFIETNVTTNAWFLTSKKRLGPVLNRRRRRSAPR
jgi:AdoMet-dependent heme synthase